MKTQQTNNDNGSWTISCTAEGVATITANGDNTRKSLKYNTSGLFSCYASGQSAVAIYSDGKGTGSVPTPPVIKTESTSVSLNHNDKTDHYMTVTITGAEADGITCKVAENADGTGEAPAWLTANYPDKDGKLSYMAEANTTNAARTAYIVLSASNADGTTSLAIKVTQNGAVTKTYTLQFGKDYNSKAISAYESSWSATCDGFTWTMTNWNNNQNGWNYVKAGSNSKALVATITTEKTIPEAISTVTMTIDAITATYVNSIKLDVLYADGKTVKETISGKVQKGDCVFNIANSQQNCKYRITVDCKKSNKNGPVQVSKVVYTNN